MVTFLLIAILIMTGWILITLNLLDKEARERSEDLWRKIDNMQNQQDGINFRVEELFLRHKAEDASEIEEYKKEIDTR
jgi:hypothetical protein